MNLNNFPQQLANIPYGQIFILTRPYKGITVLHIRMMEIIRGVSRHYHPECIIQTMAVDNPELWDCAVCKVKMEDGDEMVIANRTSLLEMLCDIWDLDQVIVSDEGKLWHVARNLPEVGEKHPTRVPLDDEPISNEKDDLTLECLQVPEKTDTLERIRSSFKDNFSYGLGITQQETSELYDYEKTHRRTYTLDIQIDKGKYNGRYYKRYGKCDISLIDNYGTKYPLPLDAKTKVIYLTYIMLKDGIEYSQIKESEEYFRFYSQIHKRMPRVSGSPKRWDLEKKEQLDTYTNYISKIRKFIYKAVGEYKPVELFAVEGDRKGIYKVQGATDEHRKLIKEAFDIK